MERNQHFANLRLNNASFVILSPSFVHRMRSNKVLLMLVGSDVCRSVTSISFSNMENALITGGKSVVDTGAAGVNKENREPGVLVAFFVMNVVAT